MDASRPAVSVVVIGRNEGERLSRCLAAVADAAWGDVSHELLYVDSQSADDSVARARESGARVLESTDLSPCAAKARNLGWREARGEFVLFLDGDTELHPAFVGRALAAMAEPAVCAVWGHRREAHPGRSIYNRVLDLDWVHRPGRTLYFGGDALVRREALEAVGGFDPTLRAGEEPELCARLRARGWEIEHIDAPMTRHDLALGSFRAYWLRAYRSGIAYAEVAARMRRQGGRLWRREAARDLLHGALLLASPLLLGAAFWLSGWAAAALLGAGALLLLRSVRRCAWKAPGQTALQFQYALHSQLQKIPALFGQLAWHRARRGDRELGLVEYKHEQGRMGARGPGARQRQLKRLLARLLWPAAGLWRRLAVDGWLRVWSHARLGEALGREVDASNVLLGPLELHGSRNIRFGRDALVYPGVYLETQGDGVIEIGDGVVLSRGVHVVAFERVSIGAGAMVGEYSSLRDANHSPSVVSVRASGHEAAAIVIGRNAWIGRGVAVLKGASVGENSVVGANAVVTRHVPANTVAGGAPARPIHRGAAA